MPKEITLNSKSIAFYKALQYKYMEGVQPFYSSLRELYSTNKTKIKEISDSQARLYELDVLLENLINPTTPTTEKDLTKVQSVIKAVTKDFDDWSKERETNRELNSKLGKVLEKTGIDLDKVIQQQKIIEGRAEEVTSAKSSLWGKFKEFSPEMAKGVGSIGSQLAKSLGPVGTVGEQAFKIGGGIIKGIRERKLAAKHKVLAGALLLPGEETPEALGKMSKHLRGVEGRASIPEDTTRTASMEREASASVSGGGIGGGSRGGGSFSVGGMVAALFTFFHSTTGMLKTKWSKSLFELLEGRGGSIKKSLAEKGSSWLKDLVSGAFWLRIGGIVGTFLTKGMLGPIILGIGTLFASFGLGRFIMNKMGWDKPVTNYLTEVIGGGAAQALQWQQDKTGTARVNDYVNKVDALVATGMSRPEAMKKVGDTLRNASTTTTAATVKPVPTVLDDSSKVNKIGFDKLHTAILDLKEGLSKVGKTPISDDSGYDAWNNRNPFLSALDGANYDIA